MLLQPDPALVTGHSLGGVVVVKAWLRGGPSAFDPLVLLGSVPDPADDVTTRGGRVLSFTGSADGKIGPEEVATGADPFRSAQVAVIEGQAPDPDARGQPSRRARGIRSVCSRGSGVVA